MPRLSCRVTWGNIAFDEALLDEFLALLKRHAASKREFSSFLAAPNHSHSGHICKLSVPRIFQLCKSSYIHPYCVYLRVRMNYMYISTMKLA